MISFIYGEVFEILEDSVVLDVGGMGYQVFAPGNVLASLPRVGEDVRLYTYLNVNLQGGSDVLQLYGFLTRDDLAMFRLCIGVSGIGPKAALGLLGTLPPDQLRFAILAEDVKAISRAPGIGPKTAKKLIVELKDRLSLQEAVDLRAAHAAGETLPSMSAAAADEAVQALVALGYSASDALRAVKKVVASPEEDTEAVLKKALRILTTF